MDSSRKVSELQLSNPAMKLGRHDVSAGSTRLKVAEQCTAVVLESTDPGDPKVTVYQDPKNGKKLLVMDHEGCLSSACKELSDGLFLLLRDRAELLLRSITVDIERTACWLYMYRRSTAQKKWAQYRTAWSLRKIEGYTRDDVYKVKSMIAKWWKPEDWREEMSEGDIDDVLEEFYKQRKSAISIAHPSVPKVTYDQLLKIAIMARGGRHKQAWPMFLAWELMVKDKAESVPYADVHIFDNPDDENRDDKTDARMLATLDGIELDPKDFKEFRAKLDSTLALEN